MRYTWENTVPLKKESFIQDESFTRTEMNIILPGKGMVYYGGSTLDIVFSLESLGRFSLFSERTDHLGCGKINDWVCV